MKAEYTGVKITICGEERILSYQEANDLSDALTSLLGKSSFFSPYQALAGSQAASKTSSHLKAQLEAANFPGLASSACCDEGVQPFFR